MLTEDMLRRIQGLDYQEEPEPKWPKRWTIFYTVPAIFLAMGLIGAGCAMWGHFAG
jgi:hypothetical protein